MNNLLIQFYDLFDKYLIKIFLGPIAVSTYTIPQQLTGKLSIISKSFSAFLLPNLSKNKIDNRGFNFSLDIFIKIIPLIIFTLPFISIYSQFLVRNSYSDTIHNLTKIFSLCAIFSCSSHLLITKFEASKTLSRNLKIEFLLMPLFLTSLYLFTNNHYSLLVISLLILFKRIYSFLFRLNLLKSEINNVKNYFFILLFFYLCFFSLSGMIIFII